MSRPTITFPDLMLVAATRALGGIGVGLLVAEHLNARQRRALGLGLLAVGALTTIPLAARILPRLRDRTARAEVRRLIEADVG